MQVHFDPTPPLAHDVLTLFRGAFAEVPKEHDVTDEYASYRLAEDLTPGKFGVIYKTTRPTKNAGEAQIVSDIRAKTQGMKDWQILQKSFDRMR